MDGWYGWRESRFSAYLELLAVCTSTRTSNKIIEGKNTIKRRKRFKSSGRQYGGSDSGDAAELKLGRPRQVVHRNGLNEIPATVQGCGVNNQQSQSADIVAAQYDKGYMKKTKESVNPN